MDVHVFRAGVIAALVSVCGSASAAPIAWKNPEAWGSAQRAVRPAAMVVRDAVAQSSADPYIIVDLASTPDANARAELLAKGLELLAPVSASSYFARVAPGADANAIAGSISGASQITRFQKMHSALSNGSVPAWSIRPSDSGGPDRVALLVKLHEGVNASDPGSARFVEALGGEVRSVVMSINTLVIEIDADRVDALADEPDVQWMEPPIPAMEGFNSSNRAATQVNTVNAAPYGLDGDGVTVFVYDGGSVLASHNDFSGRATVFDSTSSNYHATHVAGTIGGDGSVNADNRGMAPGVQIVSAGFEQSGSGGAGFLYTDPGDLEADYSTALSMGAHISNNSIGSNVAPNGFPCAWEGDYGLTAATIDAVVRGSLGAPITVFWAAGNERGSGRCGTTYSTTPPPSNNKNAISIGATNSNNNSMTSFSSWGPSDDGRVRPVISAPGCQSSGDFGVTSTTNTSNSAYEVLCGTSMASPTAAGIGALVLEDFRNQHPSWGDPSNQLMKALLVQSAADLGNTGPDYQFGYGLIQAQDAVEFVRTGNFDEDSVDQGSSSTFSVNALGTEDELKITIAWDDAPGTPNVASALVNDLDLVVTDPSGTRHYPWTLNPASPGSGAVRTQEDHLNNIEQVVVENPESGVWQISVVGTSVPQGPQGFAITSSSELGDGFLSLGLTSEVPELELPGTPIEVVAVISEGMDTMVGSAELNYRFSASDAFTSVAMSSGDGVVFTGTVPGADCGDELEFYVSAEGNEAGTVFAPPSGPAGPAKVGIGEIEVALTDNMESDNGWTVSGDALDGQWQRGVPVACDTRGAPGEDSDGSGQCWLTDNSAASSCNSDVDDGITYLTSPVYDLAGGAEFSFDYWFADISTGAINGDEWGVDVSNDGGSTWTRIRTVTSVSASWRTDTILVGEEISATSTMRFRFSANDAGTQNVIEAGLDNIRVTRFVCEGGATCDADLNEDGVLDFFDLSMFLSQQIDWDGNTSFDFFDLSGYLNDFGLGCP